MNVTIIADASHCPETKAGGYGFWIASTRGKRGGCGPLKGLVETSTLAEMMAVANAIHQSLIHGLVEPNDSLLIQTDCESAILAFDLKRKLSEAERKVVLYLQSLESKFALVILFKHVKGHTGKPDARFAANRLCDKSARKEMRRVRGNLICQDAIKLLKGSINETDAC